MLNFNKLKLDVEDTYSFVGVTKTLTDLKFYLPKGLKEKLSTFDSFDKKRDLFFQIYRVLRRFKLICSEKGYLDNHTNLAVRDRDGILRGDMGATILRNLDEEVIFYSKVDGIGALLDAYDEFKILSLARRLERSDRLDLSQIHRYLHQGLFLGNGAVYVDYMNLPRQQVQVEETDIIAMYCYIVSEVKAQLEDEVHSEITTLAERFRQQYIGKEATLFCEQDQATIVNILKEALDTIDQHTALKDIDYDQFYTAIETFLYGVWENAEDGELWGINNFHMVWESMCLTYLAQHIEPSSLLWLDSRFVPNSIVQRVNATGKLIDLVDTFTCNGIKLIPDAVIFPSRQLEVEAAIPRSCQLLEDNWDNYSYRTTFECKSYNFSRYINIAYPEQPSYHHTINELKPFFQFDKSYLLVETSLPNRFYSYWEIDVRFLGAELAVMRQLNHVFYLALQQGDWTFATFQKTILTPLKVFDSAENRDNVFRNSLFRDLTEETLEQKFNDFFQKAILSEIIDIKYLSIAYLKDKQNLERIKNRSIRKQFVYEYLLQRKLNKITNNSNITPVIKSSFWIPGSCMDQLFCKQGYLDGYLDLIQVDVATLVEEYKLLNTL